MARPPASVVFVARTHGIVGLVIGASILLLHALTRNLRGIEFGASTYYYTGGLAAFYLLAASLVWLGAPFGRLFGRLCALLYLPRPDFGSRVWHAMDSAEFQAHFRPSSPPPGPPAGGNPEKG